MMRTAAAIVLTLLLTGSAGAVTLEVTSGVVVTTDIGEQEFPVSYDLHGQNWTLTGAQGSLTIPFPVFTALFFGDPQLPLAADGGTLVLDGVSHLCIGSPTNENICGRLDFTHAPLGGDLFVSPLPPTTPTVQAPFTMVGHVLTAGGEFDLVGQGIVHAGPVVLGHISNVSTLQIVYTFTVPEPSTPMLFMVAGAAALVWVLSSAGESRRDS